MLGLVKVRIDFKFVSCLYIFDLGIKGFTVSMYGTSVYRDNYEFNLAPSKPVRKVQHTQ